MHSPNTDLPKRTILVLGASGTVGREVVHALHARGAPVRLLARSLDRVAHLPDSLERVVGDVRDRASLERALEGVTSLFYASPHATDEERSTRNVVEACEKTGARLVFVGVHADGPNRLVRALKRAMFGRMAPHYRGKMRSAEHVRRSRASPVVLLASNFYQNDELFRPELLAGTFPQCLGHRGLNRVDVRDLGEAAARALLDPEVAPGAYPVVGPATLSGPECAAEWARALGREVQYTGDSQEWVRIFEERLEEPKRSDFTATYRVLSRYHLPAEPGQLERTTRFLGRAPRPYAEYVRDTLAQWRGTQAV